MGFNNPNVPWRELEARLAGRPVDPLVEDAPISRTANGTTGASADQIYTQIEAFASYGFPESHSVSFAYLANASSWLKLYHPAAFLAGLLNAQPMGFYSPQSLEHDARRHGVTVHRVDIDHSAANASLETPDPGPVCYTRPGPAQPAVRLGLTGVRGVGDDLAATIVAAREQHGRFATITDLTARVRLDTEMLEALAAAGAFASCGLSRREALWSAGHAAQRHPTTSMSSLTSRRPPCPA